MPLFGNKKRQEEEARRLAEEERKAKELSVLEAEATKEAERKEEARREEEAFILGQTGSLGAFRKAWADEKAYYSLIDGAIAALVKDNRPQNLQYALVTPSLLQEGTDLKNASGINTSFVGSICLDLAKQGKDIEQSVAFITLALEKFSAKEKQIALDQALLDHIKHTSYGYKPAEAKDAVVIDVLLQAGANANAHDGLMLAKAVAYHTPTVVKLMRAHGAEFKDARVLMQAERWQNRHGLHDCLEKLAAYEAYDNADHLHRMEQKIDKLVAELAEARQEITALRTGKTAVILKPVAPRLPHLKPGG